MSVTFIDYKGRVYRLRDADGFKPVKPLEEWVEWLLEHLDYPRLDVGETITLDNYYIIRTE